MLVPNFDASWHDDVARAGGPAATDSSHQPAAWWHALRASRALIALSAMVLVTLWGSIAYQIGRDHDEALQHAEVNLVNLVRAFAEHTGKTLEGADQAVRFLRAEYEGHRKDLDIAAYLKEKRIIGPEYHLMSIIGADGFITHSSQPFQRVDLRDREHFRVHAEGSADRLFISKPVLGRVSKKWSIQLTRRLDGPDGRFDGVVVLSLSPDYLTRFYSEVDLGPQGAITLAGFDGIVRARATQDDTLGAQDVSRSPLFREVLRRGSGTTRATSSIDKVERVWAFHALERYGLTVVAGRGLDDVMAEPKQRATAYVAGACVLSIVIIAFVASLVRRERMRLGLMRELERSNEQANAANQMKTRFLASVSHELRTPLNGILGYAELIRDGASEAEAREHGSTIHRSAEHLHGLVNAILDLAKIESGRFAVHLSSTALAPLLADAQCLHSEHARSRGLELRLSLPDEPPLHAMADASRLLQVLNNVLDNAIKFSDQGTIEVRAARRQDRIEIAVADQGIGITRERLPSIFTRFQSASAEFTHPGQGAGLGLSLSSELMSLMGGSIRISSQPGLGTTVTLDLPASDIPPSTSP